MVSLMTVNEEGGNMKNKILKIMQQRGLDGYFVTKRENVRYLTGYTGADAWLLLTEEKSYILTDPRYQDKAEKECPDCEVINWLAYGSVAACIGELVKKERVEKLAIEKAVVTLKMYHELKEKTGVVLEGLDNEIEKLRSIKTPEEIHNLRCACNIACKAFDMLLNDFRVGITEKELESKLSYYMVSLGGDTKPNFNLMISGSRTSLLHGIPSSKSVEYGDLVLMDFGIEYRGYTSDMTRVVSVGKASEENKKLYNAANRMLDNCLSVIRDGLPAKNVSRTAYETIKGTEYEPYFYTSVGHGVGLFVHEMPFLRPISEDIIHENNVMAVEPAIFIPGKVGIHLEDNILVTKDGYENLTSTEKRLIEL